LIAFIIGIIGYGSVEADVVLVAGSVANGSVEDVNGSGEPLVSRLGGLMGCITILPKIVLLELKTTLVEGLN